MATVSVQKTLLFRLLPKWLNTTATVTCCCHSFAGITEFRKKPSSVTHSLTVMVVMFDVTSVTKMLSNSGFAFWAGFHIARRTGSSESPVPFSKDLWIELPHADSAKGSFSMSGLDSSVTEFDVSFDFDGVGRRWIGFAAGLSRVLLCGSDVLVKECGRACFAEVNLDC